MRDRIATSGEKARERALFSCIASSIPNVAGQKVSMCFQALSCQLQSTQDLVGVVKGFTGEDADFIDGKCNWTPAEHWASWWMRPDHLRMLHKDFSFMADDVWSRCPEDTNAVERKNRDSKDAHLVMIGQVIINPYKLDKSYVAKYLSAVSGNNISYTDRALMESGKAAQLRKNQRVKELHKDKQAMLGLPDKACHFKPGVKRYALT